MAIDAGARLQVHLPYRDPGEDGGTMLALQRADIARIHSDPGSAEARDGCDGGLGIHTVDQDAICGDEDPSPVETVHAVYVNRFPCGSDDGDELRDMLIEQRPVNQMHRLEVGYVKILD